LTNIIGLLDNRKWAAEGGDMINTLPAEYYLSEEIFKTEWEQIFSKYWLCIGRAEDVGQPGQYFVRQAGKEQILVVRNQEGKINAFYNICRHRGTLLIEQAKGCVNSIRCPYHAWTYDLNGKLCTVFDGKFFDNVFDQFEQPGFDRANYSLISLPLQEWEGFLFVHLSEPSAPFQESFAPMMRRFQNWNIPSLRVFYERVYEVEANWKLVLENYAECYHCPVVHSCSLTYKKGDTLLEQWPFFVGYYPFAEKGASLTMSHKPAALPLPRLSDEERKRVYITLTFPNFLLDLLPECVISWTVWPVTPTKSQVICQGLFDPQAKDSPHFNLKDNLDFYEKVNQEDWHICRLQQKAIVSKGYRTGPYYMELDAWSPKIIEQICRMLPGIYPQVDRPSVTTRLGAA
jgi:phenylpropionate dioxygenase-like ring-hydroxylating dioxygenase large terminal subunit